MTTCMPSPLNIANVPLEKFKTCNALNVTLQVLIAVDGDGVAKYLQIVNIVGQHIENGCGTYKLY